MDEPYRVLHITEKLQAAGIESFIMNVYRNIHRNKLQFDFLVTRDEPEFYDREIQQLGGKKLIIDQMHIKSTFFRVITESIELYKLFKKNPHDCVHVHSGTPLRVLYVVSAKLAGVKTRIYHSHSAEVLGPHKNRSIKKILFKVFSNMLPYFATDYFACSNAAAKWMYPKRIISKVGVIHNGIALDKFTYQPEIRQTYRQEMKLEDNFVIGHIGRFNDQKNHTYIIDIFNQLYKENKRAVLLLIGEGELKEQIQEKVRKLELEDVVFFLGIREDINKLMQAMDIFVLPSNYEGLPVVGIEAQATGIKCIMSNNITKEVVITDNVTMLPIQNNINEWVEMLQSMQKYDRKDTAQQIRENGYNIKDVAEKIEKFYLK